MNELCLLVKIYKTEASIALYLVQIGFVCLWSSCQICAFYVTVICLNIPLFSSYLDNSERYSSVVCSKHLHNQLHREQEQD